MSELDALADLQKNIAESRGKGEKLLRGFWQCAAIFGFLGFLRFFFYIKLHPGVGVGNLPFIVIGGFGLIAIALLVTGDAIFFNKAYDWENELEARQSALAARTLGIGEKHASLRYASNKRYYVLIITTEKTEFVAENISLETKATSLTFHLVADSLKDAIELLARHKAEITREAMVRA
jgi:hypothetical protein